MAASIGKVRAVFTASTGGLVGGVNQASASMRKLQKDVSSLRSGVSALATIQVGQFFAGLASSAMSAIRSLVNLGLAEAEVVDNTRKMANRLGMTYGEMAGLAHAGNLAGVGIDAIGNAATKADVAFVKATQGSAQAQAAFQKIGLSVEQLQGMSSAERFSAITQAIASLPTAAERSAAAVALFGRAGAQLLPMFEEGAAGIAEAQAEAERFGLTLTNAQANDIDSMGDAFDRAKAAISGVIQQVVAYLAPAVTAITETFSNFIGTVGGANIGQTIGDAIMDGAIFLADTADWMIAGLSKVWEYVSQIGGQWSAVWGIGQRVADFLSYVGNGMEAIFKGIGSLLVGMVGRLLNAVGELAKKVPGWGSIGRSIEQAGESMMQTSTTLWNEAGQAVQDGAQDFANAVFGRPADEAGQAIAGPIGTMLRDARSQAEASAAASDEAAQASVAAAEDVIAKVEKQKITGIDSRSKEGISEMFRIMRGGGNDVQEQQLAVMERIADNTDGMGDEGDIVDAF